MALMGVGRKKFGLALRILLQPFHLKYPNVKKRPSECAVEVLAIRCRERVETKGRKYK